MSTSLIGENKAENLSALSTKEPSVPVDAIIHVSASFNKLEAYLYIDPPENGGAAPNLIELENALASGKIIYGVNTLKLKEIAEKPRYNQKLLIAQGRMPENGVDGTCEFKIRLEKDHKPKERADGTVDYRDLEIVENVRKGQVLCTIAFPTDGNEGIAVTGEKLLPVKGKPVPSLSGKNTELSEDGRAIYSSIDGQVEYDGRKIHVNETLFIPGNVDNTTGNMKVVGNIVIEGTVLPKFVVEATGNIEICSTVEAAILKAEGNIILRSGIIGGELSCRGDLTSRFIENCNVLVNGNIKADYIMNSNLKCGKSIQLVGSKGKILGGSCIAGQDIVASIIGSVTGAATELMIGTDPGVIERQQELLKQLPGLQKQIQSLKSLISILQQLEAANRLTPEKEKTLKTALMSYETCNTLLASSNQELVEINKSLLTKGYGRVVCSGTIFPGTIIKIGSAQIPIIDILNSTLLYYSEGRICQSLVQ